MSIQRTVDGTVGRITLDAPDRLNAVDAPMLRDLSAAIRALDGDPAVRAIVITGAGRGFCAGADLSIGADGEATVDDGTLVEAGNVVRLLIDCATPTLAAVNGVAAGVGVSIALACDYVVATQRAAFVLAFANIALMPDGGATALVAASIGRARAQRLALTGEKLPAQTAQEWGLIAQVASEDDFDAEVDTVAARLAWLSPAATAHTTRAINAATVDLEAALHREEAGQRELLEHGDFREGVAAFTGKRTATFTGA